MALLEVLFWFSFIIVGYVWRFDYAQRLRQILRPAFRQAGYAQDLQHYILHQRALIRVICIEMQSTAFFAELRAFHDQIANRDHIA